MRIIIVGCGKVGATIAEQLVEEGHDIAVIDMNADAIQSITNKIDVLGVVGNGVSYSVQKEAGIEEADLLIAMTGSDEQNLLCCLFAKKVGNCNTIARVRNPLYSHEISYIKDELGLSMVINPEFAAATEMARLLRFPSADRIDTFAKGRVEILKFVVHEDSVLAGNTLMDIGRKLNSGILFCAVERKEEVVIPKGDFMLQANDVVSMVASPKDAKQFFEKIGVETHQVKDALIVGGGTIAYYLAEQLISMGIHVKIIEQDAARCEVLSELLPDAVIIQGDATNHDILQEEGIQNTEAFVALTGLDEGNIFLSLYAQSCSKAKIITKINRISMEEVVSNFQLGSLIYPKHLTAEYIIRYVRAVQNSVGSDVEAMSRLIGNKVEALEFRIKEGSIVVGKPIMELKLKKNVLIACISRKGKIIRPNGQTEIHIGDTVIIVTTQHGLRDINDILG